MKDERRTSRGAAAPDELVMDAIVTQALAPSQKVSENILCERFGISRTLARNLIERLTAKHFLVPVSPRITVVAPLTLLDIKQNFMLRKLLLPSMFALASANIDYDNLKTINRQIQEMQPIIDDDGALAILKKNKEFNLALCAPVGYPLMLDWAQQLEDTAMRIYWLYLKTRKQFPYTSDQQGMILDVMQNQETNKIQAAIHSLLAQTEERVLNAVFTHEQFYKQDLKV